MENKHIIGRKAFIFNKQKYNLYDGPGVRSLIFFKGCPLRCKWCANPEGLERKYQIMLKPTVCVSCGACVKACQKKSSGALTSHNYRPQRDPQRCIGCGECVQACPNLAWTRSENKYFRLTLFGRSGKKNPRLG